MHQPEADYLTAGSGTSPIENLTPEEFQIVKRCNYEAQMHRGIPVAILTGLGASWAIKSGVIKPRNNILVIGTTSLLGFILGKASYLMSCINQKLPKSTITRIREERFNQGQRHFTPQQRFEQQSPQRVISEESKDFHKHDGISLDPQATNDFDSSAPSYSDDQLPDDHSDQNIRPYNDYDDLRAQNRKKYAESHPNEIVRPSSSSNFFWDEPRRYVAPDETAPREEVKPKYQRKNQYGDVFD